MAKVAVLAGLAVAVAGFTALTPPRADPEVIDGAVAVFGTFSLCLLFFLLGRWTS